MCWLAVLVWVAGAAARGARAATAASVLDGEIAELAAVVRDSCLGDTGLDGALLARVDGGAALVDVDDATLKCYIKCTMEMAGMMSDGEVDVDAVLELLPAAVAARVDADIRRCGTRSGADHCDTAFLTQVCWQTANKDDYFII